MQTLVRGGTVVTCDATDRVVQGDVLVEGGADRRIGSEARKRAPAGDGPRDRRARVRGDPGVRAGARAPVPGALSRDGRRHAAPRVAAGAHLAARGGARRARRSRASAELGLAEMMRAGRRRILDMGTVHGHDAVMDACVRSGMRAISGKAMMDVGDGVPKGLRESTRASLDESERLARGGAAEADGGRHRLRVRAAVHPVVQRGARARGGRSAPRRTGRSCTRTPRSTPASARRCAARSGTTTWRCCARWGVTRAARHPRARRAAHATTRRAARRGGDADRALPEREPEARLRDRARGGARRARRAARARRRRRALQQQPGPLDRAPSRRAPRQGAHGRDDAPGAARAPARHDRRRARALARRASPARSRSGSAATSPSSGSTARTPSRAATCSRASSTPAARATWCTCSSTASPSFGTARAPASTSRAVTASAREQAAKVRARAGL